MLKVDFNNNYSNLEENYLFSEVARKRREYEAENPDKKLISLGIGDVSMPLPDIVLDAFHKAVDEMGTKKGFRGYGPEYGYGFLREAVADYYKRKTGRNIIEASDVFISDGAKSDSAAFAEILGDNITVVPNPVYPVYLDSNVMLGRKIEFMTGNKENKFLPMPADMAHVKTPSVIYLCSPNNPTGAVYNRTQLKEWVDFAIESGSLIIFDAAYEGFISEDLPKSIFEIEGARSSCVEINSLSKTGGFTGVRCGWTIVPQELELHKLWSRRQATKFNGVSYPVQRAAQAALSQEGMEANEKNVSYYMENARIISQLMTSKGIYYTGGEASPYIWFECPAGMNSWDLFDLLLEKAQLIGTPGVGFGQAGEGFFRLTSFSDRESTLEAVDRMDKFLDSIIK